MWGYRLTVPRSWMLILVGLFLVIAFSARAGTNSTVRTAFDVGEEVRCLALTIYFEARGEPDEGKLAVGHVVMNRVRDPRYPSRVCGVVRQGGEWPRNRCPFSWWCDGRSDKPRNHAAWERATAFARLIYWGFSKDPTGGALWYHADYVSPVWRKVLGAGPKIGRHQFYTAISRLGVSSGRLLPKSALQ